MKKIFLAITLCILSTTAFSQGSAQNNPFLSFLDWSVHRYVVNNNENWQGYYDCDAVIEHNFDEAKTVNSIKIKLLSNPSVGITLPTAIHVYAFPIDAPELPDTFVQTFKIDEKTNKSGNQFFTEEIKLNGLKTKYLRIVIENKGSLIYTSEPVIE